jgi:hypothetical protein
MEIGEHTIESGAVVLHDTDDSCQGNGSRGSKIIQEPA